MTFKDLADTFEQLEKTSKRLEKTVAIASLLQKTPPEKIDKILLLLQGRVFPDWDRTSLNVAAKTIIKALAQASGHTSDYIENEWKTVGDLGLVAEHVFTHKKQATLFAVKIDIDKIFANLQKIPTMSGKQSVQSKISLISELLTSVSPREAKYIVRITLEVMRIGAGLQSLRDAVIWSCFPNLINALHEHITLEAPSDKKIIQSVEELDKLKAEEYPQISTENTETARTIYNYLCEQFQQSYDMCNDLARVAKCLKKEGIFGLTSITLQVGIPLRVMLAQKVTTVKDGFAKVGTPSTLEYKYDGFRMQIHIGKKITLFTRRLEEVTEQFPDVVKVIEKHINCESAIIDCEVVGYDKKTNMYLPFQHISQRIRRKHNISELVKQVPVEIVVFDIMYKDGENILQKPLQERRKILTSVVDIKERSIITSRIMITDNEDEANKFYQESLDAGNEGIMLKSLDAPYKPGSRVGFMIKLKPVMETLDLVITKAFWGEGRRTTHLTSFVVSCYDDGELKELGKVSTGLKELESEGTSFKEMTELLEPLIISENGKEIQVKPEIVIEVAFEEIQKSTTYSSGFALRFPRFIRLREREASEVSTLEFIQEMFDEQ